MHYHQTYLLLAVWIFSVNDLRLTFGWGFNIESTSKT